MKLVFLGTGTSQGIPVIGCRCEVCLSQDPKDKRLRSSVLVKIADDPPLVIDCGPDFRYQMLRSNTDDLEGVLLTHEHYDHTAGLDDLRPFGFITGEPVRIFACDSLLSTLKQRMPYAFGDRPYPGAPQFETFILEWNRLITIAKYSILPLEVFHGNLRITGFKIGEHLAYITDANGMPEATFQSIKDIPFLIINALHHRPHHAHYTLEQTIDQIQALNPGRAYLIHMSHHMGLHSVVSRKLPGSIELAYDGLEINIPD